MQNIEINTTQNVRITYEVAHLGDRSFAFLIDLIVIGAGFIICSIAAAIFDGEASSWIWYLIALPYFMFYTLVSEIIMKGQTLGKRALKIQVVKLNGEEAKPSDYFLRWIFRLIDIYLSFGILAAIFIATSKKGQRLGDLVSETSTIRIKPSSEMSLMELEAKYSRDPYEPKYTQVKKLSESDMLLVQNVVLRYKRYKNKAHREALYTLCDKIKERLNLNDNEVSEEGTDFLTTLIKDYIVLTR